MKIQPLPCPFCGQKPKFSRISDALVKPELPHGYWSLGCPGKPDECTGHPMSFGDTKGEALEGWNRRVPSCAVQ
jgi:hypothetical protein